MRDRPAGLPQKEGDSKLLAREAAMTDSIAHKLLDGRKAAAEDQWY